VVAVTLLVDTSVLTGSVAPPRTSERYTVSVVSVGELEAGVLLAKRGRARAERLARLTAVLTQAIVLPVDRHVATFYGRLRARAKDRKPHSDLWIAATALAHGLTLVTTDERQAALPLVRTELIGGR
jgi:predicted nucleic acid-binding protein